MEPFGVAQQLVLVQQVALADNVVQQPKAHAPVQNQQQHVHQEQQRDVPQDLPQTHTGHSWTDVNPGWQAAHILGHEPALAATADITYAWITPFRKHGEPEWGTRRRVKERLAMFIALHRPGMRRPNLAWYPDLPNIPIDNPENGMALLRSLRGMTWSLIQLCVQLCCTKLLR